MYAVRLLFSVFFVWLSISGRGQVISQYIHVDQFGYLPEGKKVAVFSNPVVGFDEGNTYAPSSEIQVVNAETGEVVFSGVPQAWQAGALHEQSGNYVWRMDFSELAEEGTYYILDAEQNLRSVTFEVSADVYNDLLNAALKAFYYERCGSPKEVEYAGSKWGDAACHLADTSCRYILDPEDVALERDLSGGWHESDVYFKTVNDAFYPVHLLLSAYQRAPNLWSDELGIPESGNGLPDILDEVKWELDWLVKMQQADGSVLMKVANYDWSGESPPSEDDIHQRFYAAAQSSATRRFSSMLAHAAQVFAERPEPEWQAYADTLLSRAEAAWFWVVANPGYSYYDNAGFENSNPEIDEYEQDAALTLAALYLYAATGSSLYKDFFEFRYSDLHPIDWSYWFPWEGVIQDGILFYLELPDATPSLVEDIRGSFMESMEQNNPALLTAYMDDSCAYLSYLPDYGWASNRLKLHTARLFAQALQYGMDTVQYAEEYRSAMEHYLHYLHGVNPLNKVFVSNMGAYGAENSCNEIYHYWFYDGTDWDNAEVSLYGPAPGFLVSGPNQYYEPDESYGGIISPPQFQPPMKSYLDWNGEWPENSWYVSLVNLEAQAAYVRLLAELAAADVLSTSTSEAQQEGKATAAFSLFPNPAKEETFVKWKAEPQPVEDWILRDVQGQFITNLKVEGGRVQLPSHLSSGTYLLEAVGVGVVRLVVSGSGF